MVSSVFVDVSPSMVIRVQSLMLSESPHAHGRIAQGDGAEIKRLALDLQALNVLVHSGRLAKENAQREIYRAVLEVGVVKLEVVLLDCGADYRKHGSFPLADLLEYREILV